MLQIIKTKQCSKCKEVLDITHFHPHSTTKSGLQSQCKQCTYKGQQQYYATEHGKTMRRMGIRKFYSTDKGKIAHRENARLYRIRHPHKIIARFAVAKAVKSGNLPKPSNLFCYNCGNGAEQYHHHGYEPEHWFDVIALCIPCHRAIHNYI